MTVPAHGANLFELAQKYHFSLEDILDFSSNINPFGASQKALSHVRNNLNQVSIYPDPSYTNLKNAIASYVQTSPSHIVLGNGATNLISGFIEYVMPKRALVIAPSYSEYERELQKIDSQIFYHTLRKEDDFRPQVCSLIQEVHRHNVELVVLCNPNNPTGSLFSREDLRAILTQTQAYVMVDETYIEFTDQASFSSVPLTEQFPHLFVIRGTSKFFATPGIRLGYGVLSEQKLIQALTSTLDLWGINIFATLMGEVMFLDETYLAHTYDLIHNERSYLLDNVSKLAALRVYPSQGNFILCEILRPDYDAFQLYEALIAEKIAVRNCASFPTLGKAFFRVCTLTHAQNELLIQALQKIFG